MRTRSYLCYATGHRGEWEAICVDLDLAVHGKSFDEVLESLNAMIATYVEDACKEESETRESLLNRRAPFGVRLKLAWDLFRHQVLRKRDDDDGSYAGFDVPCHA
jgi:predicted RNase H-like HicB family nuclease